MHRSASLARNAHRAAQRDPLGPLGHRLLGAVGCLRHRDQGAQLGQEIGFRDHGLSEVQLTKKVNSTARDSQLDLSS